MSLESVGAFFADKAPDIRVIVSDGSSATVALAAEAHSVATGRIAKTLSMRIGERVVLIVARGDARLDNRTIKASFGAKPRLLGPEEVVVLTGHPVGACSPSVPQRRCQSIVTCRFRLSTKSYLRPAPPTAPSGSRRSAWRISSAPIGSMSARMQNDGCHASSEAAFAVSASRAASGARRTCRPRCPPLIKTYGSSSAAASMAVGTRFLWPNGLMPPTR